MTFTCVIGEYISTVSNIVVAGAAVVAAAVALLGLNAWKEQLAGRIEYDLSRSLLKSVFEVRNSISSARSPFLQYASEPDFPEEKLKRLSDEEKKWHALVQAYQKRLTPLYEAAAALDSNTVEAEVVWGQEIVRKIATVKSLIIDLRWAISDLLEELNPKEQGRDRDAELKKERQETLYERSKLDKDPYRQKLDSAIAAIEAELRTKLKRYHKS